MPYEVVCVVAGFLAVLAVEDRRAWCMLVILGIALAQTAFIDAMVSDRLMALALRIVVDLCCGWLSIQAMDRGQRWTMMIPAIFVLMLLCHSLFWLMRWNGIDIWLPYAHSLNVLFLAHLIACCWPSGGRLIGIAHSWLGGLVAWWSRAAGLGNGSQGAPASSYVSGGGGTSNVRSHCSLYVPSCD